MQLGASTSLPTTTGQPLGPYGQVHQLYAAFAPIWEKLAHCYEGTGGFLDGGYLIAHPREWEDHAAEAPKKPTKKFRERKNLARYENIAATIVDTLAASLFSVQPSRQMRGEAIDPDSDLGLWLADVDGLGTSLDEYLMLAWRPAAAIGHVWLVMDRPDEGGSDALPYLSTYTPLDVLDWTMDRRGQVTALKLLEAEQRADLDQAAISTQPVTRLITADGWAVKSAASQDVRRGNWDLADVPAVILYGKRRGMVPYIGQSVLYDPQLYVDLYNLTSELRELLRKQTFGILNVPLGAGSEAMSAEQAIELLGKSVSTQNVLFTGAPAGYISPDAANVTVYQAERDYLLRTIYRLSGLPWEADTRDAESADSRKLKREDLQSRLAHHAKELAYAEMGLLRRWCQWTYGTSWEREWDKMAITVRYPDRFEVTPFESLIEQATAATNLQYPPEFMAALQKRLLPQFLPDISQKDLDAIAGAIERNVQEAARREQQREQLELEALRVGVDDAGAAAA